MAQNDTPQEQEIELYRDLYREFAIDVLANHDECAYAGSILSAATIERRRVSAFAIVMSWSDERVARFCRANGSENLELSFYWRS